MLKLAYVMLMGENIHSREAREYAGILPDFFFPYCEFTLYIVHTSSLNFQKIQSVYVKGLNFQMP